MSTQSKLNRPKRTLRILHRVAGGVAFILIASFWLATVVVELMGSTGQITMVKTAIAWGLILLVPCLAATGGSGFALAHGHIVGPIAVKLRRMKLIAANGIVVLVPCAITLALFAQRGQIDGLFMGIQMLELFAGLINLVLIGLNIRDGVRMHRSAGYSVHV